MENERLLDERRRALEEAFFLKRERELVEKLRAEEQKKSAKEALAAAAGVHDERLLDKLVERGVSQDALSAFSLTPLVAVAWADREIHEKERDAVLRAAEKGGVLPGTPAHALLGSWLEHRPGPELLDAWCNYVRAPRPHLSAADRATLKREVLDHARAVAEATGGFLGIGQVSRSEKEILERIERAFDDPAG
jgi:hypothetical protein